MSDTEREDVAARHNVSIGMVDGILPEGLVDVPNHILVDDEENDKKLVKVSSFKKFADLCAEEKDNVVNSEVVAYGLPYLSLSDSFSLGVSMGSLICNDVAYKLGNPEIVNRKIQKHLSSIQKMTTAEILLSDIREEGRPKSFAPDLEWYELSRRHASGRYIASLMRTGNGMEVHSAIKACSNKLHTQVYGGDLGYDEYCNPDDYHPAKAAYTNQKLEELTLQYLQDYPDALDPVDERKNLLAAEGQLSQKKIESELRNEYISLVRSFELQFSEGLKELQSLVESHSLAGNGVLEGEQ